MSKLTKAGLKLQNLTKEIDQLRELEIKKHALMTTITNSHGIRADLGKEQQALMSQYRDLIFGGDTEDDLFLSESEDENVDSLPSQRPLSSASSVTTQGRVTDRSSSASSIDTIGSGSMQGGRVPVHTSSNSASPLTLASSVSSTSLPEEVEVEESVQNTATGEVEDTSRSRASTNGKRSADNYNCRDKRCCYRNSSYYSYTYNCYYSCSS